jgi:predicted lipoprotein with Yx(FWY)xxD motif
MPRWEDDRVRALLAMVMTAGLLVLSACGSEEENPATGAPQSTSTRSSGTTPTATAAGGGAAKKARGTKLIVDDSAFGTMLFDAGKQAIYVFERDADGRTACYGECAKAWPPVYTIGDPVAGAGVKPGLLGTLNRRDGTRQVTYAGKPLYFYAHERPGQVLCHNVNLNGGYWWVLAPSGKRRA